MSQYRDSKKNESFFLQDLLTGIPEPHVLVLTQNCSLRFKEQYSHFVYCENSCLQDTLPSYDVVVCHYSMLESLLKANISAKALLVELDSDGGFEFDFAELLDHGFYHDLQWDDAKTILFRTDMESRQLVRTYQKSYFKFRKLADKNLELQDMLAMSDDLLNNYRRVNDELTEELEQIRMEKDSIIGSTFWKITKPFRWLADKFKTFLSRYRVTRLIIKGLSSLKNKGVRATYQKTMFRLAYTNSVQHFAELCKLSDEERTRQIETKFEPEYKISILVPLYNTPENFLREMIDSVINQTYSNWELCLADGSDEAHAYVGDVVREYQQKDARILYTVLEENYGISENTNRCIEMATGDYIGLFDHDDLLHPGVLYEDMKAICDQGADFIYTDEMTFEKDIKHPITVHCKPDFAIDNLRANNYICHFSVFSKKLLDQVGGFRDECNGSQDFDLVLRLTEKAKKIVHIPKVLYFWRSHAGSVASDISVKPYCITAGKKAVEDHLMRQGIQGEVSAIPGLGSTFRVKYTLKSYPLISIIIPNKGYANFLKACIHSILRKTTYHNYEIILVNEETPNAQAEQDFSLLKNERIRSVKFRSGASINEAYNYGASIARGDYFVFLHSDVRVTSPEWLEELLMFAQRDDVGAVGAKLYYPNNTVQHAGFILGIHGTVGVSHLGADMKNYGYMGRLYYAQDFSAVSSACLMISRENFESAGGFDCNYLRMYADVDLCLKLRQKQKLNVFTPFAELYHDQKTTGLSRHRVMNKAIAENLKADESYFLKKWKPLIDEGDPYYNLNFSLEREDFILRS